MGQRNLTLATDDCSAPRPVRFGTYWLGGWVGTRSGSIRGGEEKKVLKHRLIVDRGDWEFMDQEPILSLMHLVMCVL